MTKINIRLLIILTILFIATSSFVNNSTPNDKPTAGVYDGQIGNDRMILIIKESTDEKIAGYYLFNRNNAVEKDHEIAFSIFENEIHLTADNFTGIFKGEISESKILGKVYLSRHKSKLFFWRNKRKIKFIKRAENILTSSDRYQQKVFDEIAIHSDLIYGKANGYWTEAPYLDDPYIEVLSKGTINLLKGEKELELKLDIYYPKNDTLAYKPLILLVHGGGFYIGNKSSITEKILAEEFTKRGYVVASMDYRMGFKMTTSDVERSGYKAVQDVHAALRFLSHHAKTYGIDPSQIYVAGTSAGAIASLNIAFMDNDERPKSTYGDTRKEDLGSIESSGNSYKNKFEIKAVGNMWGAVTDTLIIDKEERIPVISFHGTNDKIVPYNYDYPFQHTFMINRIFMEKMYGSEPIHQHLDNMGIENRFVTLEGSGHEPHLDNFESTNAIFDVILKELILFFYEQTAAKIALKTDVISISNADKIKPLQLKIENGEMNYLEVDGGFKVSSKPSETRIIWIKGHPHQSICIHAKNKFDAWSKKSVDVELID